MYEFMFLQEHRYFVKQIDQGSCGGSGGTEGELIAKEVFEVRVHQTRIQLSSDNYLLQGSAQY